MQPFRRTALAIAILATVSACNQDATDDAKVTESKSDPVSVATPAPSAEQTKTQPYPNTVLWGDTHLHPSYSMDAGLFGNRLPPEDAYRFARGEAVTSSTGVKAQLTT
ncbi:DUF3604 domain-containing protein, partial [Marinobacter alexandrii]|uniref:DUF3604 domain-containing protein n=1 Tax=Marinobacter alexandrii TaxID=2570351 RepID=UPI00329989C7